MFNILLQIWPLLNFGLYCSAVGSPRILGGFQTNINIYGYTVSIQYSSSHICGGAIISPKVIVSAAHCIRFDPQLYSIRVGSTYSDKDGEIYKIREVIRHPAYNRTTADNDINLILLKNGLVFNSVVRNLQLPTYRQAVPTNTVGLVTGWGTTNGSNIKIFSSTLKGVYLRVRDINYCRSIYPQNAIIDRMFCAGSFLPEDVCAGDSGGPMVTDNVLIGVVSYGFSCANVQYPGLFTNVANVLDFVSKHIHNLTTGQPTIEQTRRSMYPGRPKRILLPGRKLN